MNILSLPLFATGDGHAAGGLPHAFQLVAVVLVVAAVFSFVNYRFLKLPSTIGLMIVTLVMSLLAVIIGRLIWPTAHQPLVDFVSELRFEDAVLDVLLGFLLFAGALHIDLEDLLQFKVTISLLVVVGVVLSTVIVAGLTYVLLGAMGLAMPFIYCLLFGALISPTDPIAVLGLLKRLGAPAPLATKIAGESLFNDGIGVVLFLGLLSFANNTGSIGGFAMLFVQEAVGGAVLGGAVGLLAFWMLRQVDNYHVEVLMSLALVAGGYALAAALHLSGPIAMVVAGLLIGNHGRALAMSPRTVKNLDLFWELVDEILNAVLFVLIGLEFLVLSWRGDYLLAGLLAIAVTLSARFVAVWLPISAMRSRQYDRYTVYILTWGGLRGGISVALALALPHVVTDAGTDVRSVILAMTYVVVVFSIIVQGLTIAPCLKHWLGRSDVYGPTP